MLGVAGIAGPPPGDVHQAGLDQVQAVEEPQDFGVAAGLEVGGGLSVVRHALGDMLWLAVGGAVADHHIAAGCERVTQLGDQGAGVLVWVVGQEVEDRDQQQRGRLGQVEQACRPG